MLSRNSPSIQADLEADLTSAGASGAASGRAAAGRAAAGRAAAGRASAGRPAPGGDASRRAAPTRVAPGRPQLDRWLRKEHCAAATCAEEQETESCLDGSSERQGSSSRATKYARFVRGRERALSP